MRTMSSMVPRRYNMDRATRKFNNAAGINIIIGIVSLIVGVTCGVLSIVSGAMILSGKKEMEF